MSALKARAAARLAGAALTAGAEFVTGADLVERLQRQTEAGQGPPNEFPPAPPHLAVHFVGDEAVPALLLGAAERDEGVHGTYLFPALAQDHTASVAAARALQRMGHRIGAWVPAATLEYESGAETHLARLLDALARRSVRRIDVLGTNMTATRLAAVQGEGPDVVHALQELCERHGVPCWLAGDTCGGREPTTPLLQVRDSTTGWSLHCTAPAYEVAATENGEFDGVFASCMCDFAARGPCLYQLSTDLYE